MEYVESDVSYQSDESSESEQEVIDWNPELILQLQIMEKECILLTERICNMGLGNSFEEQDHKHRGKVYMDLCSKVRVYRNGLDSSREKLFLYLKEAENGPHQYLRQKLKKSGMLPFFECHAELVKNLNQWIEKIQDMK